MGSFVKGWSAKASKQKASEQDADSSSWKQHWLNYSIRPWPEACSVSGCDAGATIGAHVHHPDHIGDRIAPMCNACAAATQVVRFKQGTSLVSAGSSRIFH